MASVRCSPTGPAPPVPADLEVWQTDGNGNAQRVFARDFRNFNAAFGAGELEIVPSLELFDPAGQRTPMSVDFLRTLLHHPHGSVPLGGGHLLNTLQNQANVFVFARDPQELFDTLKGLTDDNQAWLLNTSEAYLPTVLGIASPNRFGTYFAAVPAPEGDFFQSLAEGPGAAPVGRGSIKAMRVYQHGWCSHIQPVTDILRRVTNGFMDNLFDPTGDPCSTAIPTDAVALNANVYYTNATSYLAHREGELTDLRGGFLFASSVSVFDKMGRLDPCNANFNEGYEFALLDGRLGVIPDPTQPFPVHAEGNRTICTGISQPIAIPGVTGKLEQALTHKIPDTLFGTASFLQSFPTDKIAPAPGFDGCEPDRPNPCDTSANIFQGLIDDGGRRAGLSVPEIDRVKMTSKHLDQNGVLTNWRCVNRPGLPTVFPPPLCLVVPPPNRFRCEYIIRATRINVLPVAETVNPPAPSDTAVELVFFDSPKQFDAPAIPLYYASFAAGQPGPFGPEGLCSRQPDGIFLDDRGPVTFVSNFSNVHGLGQLGCQNVSPPPPPGCDPASRAATQAPRRAQATNDQPPSCSAVKPSPKALWPPDRTFDAVSLLGATDPDGDSLTMSITSVRQDENPRGAIDAELRGTSLFLRAARDGAGDGRVYHVQFTETDPQGASCRGEVTVCVPRDQSGSGCVDEGALFPSGVP